MNTLWNVIKYPALTLTIVVEFFILAAFSTMPIEHSVMTWLVTILVFEMSDQIFLKQEEM